MSQRKLRSVNIQQGAIFSNITLHRSRYAEEYVEIEACSAVQLLTTDHWPRLVYCLSSYLCLLSYL